MTHDETVKCNAIIHSASGASAAVGAGLAQLPCSDNAIITPIQLTMAISLAKVFGLTINDGAAKAAVASAAAAVVGRTASQVFCGWFPVIGNIINAATAAGVTEAIGWALANEFERQASYGRGR